MPVNRYTIAGFFAALGVFGLMLNGGFYTAQCAIAALSVLAIGWWISAWMPPTTQFWSIVAGVAVAAAVWSLMEWNGAERNQSWTAAVTALCACWWIFESLPLSVTSLVPAVLFPLTGVLTPEQVATSYGDPYILLFLGGFVLAAAAEHWGAHRRLAQMTVAWVGGSSGRSVVFGVMLATTLVSMWIGNTAVALMMLPVAMAVLDQDRSGKLAVPLLLGVAYCASIGGIATPVGTAPNGVFMSVYKRTTGLTVPFHEWMLLALPISLLMLVAAWLLLTWRLAGVGPIRFTAKEPWTTPQKRTLAVFGLVCLGWILREVPYGGWQAWLNVPNSHDMMVALAGVLALFLIPSGDPEQGGCLITWEVAVRIPWGVLVLFAGGIAIASAFTTSGLATVIGDKFHSLQNWPPLAILAVLCFSVTFLSEFTSNTATSNILMPVLASMAIANKMEPAMLMVPATLSNSLAFMMPVGTPPNAIAYGTGHVRMRDMVRAGFVLNIIGAVIVTAYCWIVLPWIFRISQ